jgi:hypothetical protein
MAADGPNICHRQFVKLAKKVKISASDSSFAAVSKRNLARKGSFFKLYTTISTHF